MKMITETQLSFVFKCLTDTVILDDFKTALDRLRHYWLRKQAINNGEIFLHNRLSTRPRSQDLEVGGGGGGRRGTKSDIMPLAYTTETVMSPRGRDTL